MASMGLSATYYGANGWLLEFSHAGEPPYRILLDPWLVGDLTFPPGRWLFSGRQPRQWPIPQAIDLLLLTQGLADHSHPPTLALLPRTLPVVASPTAATVVRSLGFQDVHQLSPGDGHTPKDSGGLEIKATLGAPVPQAENGYLLLHPAGKLYLEPHGFLPPEALLPAQHLDAVITPVVDLGLPVAGAFVKGRQVLTELVQRFRPACVLASTTGGGISFDGLLTRLLWQKGSLDEAAAILSTLPGQPLLIDPVPGEPIRLNCSAPAPVGLDTVLPVRQPADAHRSPHRD